MIKLMMFASLGLGSDVFEMISKGIKYAFVSKTWKYKGTAGWHFISLPEKLSKEIRENHKWQEEGWGRMKAVAKIRETEWKTAIWFDTKMKTYLLPLKAEIRKKEKLQTGKNIRTVLWI